MDRDQIAFLHAAEVCDIETMQKLLDRGVCDFDARNSDGETALMIALQRRFTDLAILLINYGADVNCCDINNWNALHVASSYYYDDEVPDCDIIVRLLVSKVSDIDAITSGENGGHTALSLAAIHGHKRVVDILIQSGANVSIGSTDSLAVFQSAVCSGWMDIVEATVNDINVNTAYFGGYTPLMLASKEVKHYGIVNLLLKCGANIYLKDYNNCTALYYAVPDVELIILFINNGAYLEHIDYTEIHKNALCREQILRNTELCVRIAINEYNNFCLPKLYQMYSSVIKLPLIDNLKIKNNQNVISEIERSVKCEIQSKTFCNVMDLRPLVLQMMAVRSLIANRF